jgi:glycosyltransferase involved in cell wall biosynthesis
MSPLSVLHVVTSLEPGGMENGVCNLARELEPRGVVTNVACLERRGPFAGRLPDSSRVEVLGKRTAFSPGAVLRLARAIRRWKPRIVHTHNFGPLIYGALATFWGRSPALLHGEHSLLAPWELMPKRLKQRRVFYRACRAIHTVSTPQREELIGLGFPAQRVLAISNGVDTSKFTLRDRSAARHLLSLPDDVPVIGLAGRFGPHKGHQTMLEAFAKMGHSSAESVLVFFGTGGSKEAAVLQTIAEHPFGSRIHVAGYRPDLEQCYPALDLLVLPSTNEGASNVALEAMACGVPVLANTGVGNEPMIRVGEDGWIEDLRDPAVLACLLKEKLSDRASLRVMGEKARRAVESRFSLGQMVDAYEQLYRRLAN